MFKNLYNNILNTHINFKSHNSINLFTFLKKSTFLKNHSNYLNFYVTLFNQLKAKTIQTSFWVFTPDCLLPLLNYVLITWIVIEICCGF